MGPELTVSCHHPFTLGMAPGGGEEAPNPLPCLLTCEDPSAFVPSLQKASESIRKDPVLTPEDPSYHCSFWKSSGGKKVCFCCLLSP